MAPSDPLYDAILLGNEPSSVGAIASLLADGASADDVLHKICIPATQEARQRLEEGIFYIPDIFISLRVYLSVLEVLKPHLSAESYQQALGYGEYDVTCHL